MVHVYTDGKGDLTLLRERVEMAILIESWDMDILREMGTWLN